MKDLVIINNDTPVTTSLKVAEVFGKEHRNVIRDIRDVIKQAGGMLKNEQTPMFEETTYIHEQNGQTYPMYYLNRDGFTLLAMGFNGKKALNFKLQYIKAFNRMEEKLKQLLSEGKNQIWFEVRQQAKDTYKDLGSVKKLFIEYARHQGYDGENKYIYSNLAIKTNQFVGLPKRGGRDSGTIPQLNVLSIIENGMRETLIHGMDEGLHYTRIIAKVDIWLDKFRKESYIDSYLNTQLLK